MPVHSEHPQYQALLSQWERCRDVEGGRDAVLARDTSAASAVQGGRYVPMLGDEEWSDYKARLQRGLFFPATGRTVQFLVGGVFRREPEAVNFPFDDFLVDVDLMGTPFSAFAKKAFKQVVNPSRFGVLTDWSNLDGRPYWSAYTAENIINWRSVRVGGRLQRVLVVLRERGSLVAEGDPFVEKAQERIRVLFIDPLDGFYKQQIWLKLEGGTDQDWMQGPVVVPSRQGEPFRQIPFAFFNASGNFDEPDPPALLGLADVNLDHWRLMVDYRHGLHYTALPTAIAAGFPSGTVYKIGGRAAWISTDADAKAYYLEFKGEGLNAIKDALEDDDQRMAAIGGRVLERPRTVAEAAQTVRLRATGDEATLQSLTDSSEVSLSASLGHAAFWMGANPDLVEVRLNRDFFNEPMATEDAVRLMQVVQAGYMTEENYLWLLRQGELIRPGVTLDDEQKLLALRREIRSILDAEQGAVVEALGPGERPEA